jgi:chemotaxis protein histidine kinase CheA
MIRPQISPFEARVRQARRRLVIQLLLNRLGVAWGCALAVGLLWMLVEPFAVPGAAASLKWMVLASAAGMGTIAALWAARRAAPTPLFAALAIDQRFDLKERVTTALGLSPHIQSSPAGQALMADANAKLEKLAVGDKFPVRVGWRALFLPAQAAAIALLALYPPSILTSLAGGESKKDDDQATAENKDAPSKPAMPRTFIKPPIERPNKSEELRQLEAELEKLYAEHNKQDGSEKDKPEQVRERQEQIAKAEERLRKREQEMAEKFQRLQEQMDKLTELEQGEALKDGPAKEFEQALAKGDLKKAQDEAEKLQKKAKDNKLDAKDQEQLKKQMEDMEKKLDRAKREQEQKKQDLKDLIEKAKRENRDADSLERELKNLMNDQQMTKEMQELSKCIKGVKQSLDMNDFDGVAEQLGQMAKQLGDIQDDLKDLEDIEEHLQNLKQMKKEGCKECEGQCKGKGPGKDKDDADGYAEGATGRRPENKDAVTKPGDEQRIRGFFDPKGRKTYGGATTGPAFKKASSVEMAGDIRQAVQDAPDAVEVQRLPKAARDMVKEYFEKLGNQAPGPKK